MKFWTVTWGQLAPGDLVRAPNDTVWTVRAAIVCDGDGEWCLVGDAGAVIWTPHRGAGEVMAARPAAPRTEAAAMSGAVELLAEILGAREVSST